MPVVGQAPPYKTPGASMEERIMELWKTKYNLQTREVTDAEVWKILDWVLGCFARHGIVEVTMIYGYEWDIASLQWEEKLIEVGTIRDRVKALEDEGCGRLGQDDLFIRIDDRVEVQFCHHADVHLRYDEDDSPLISDLRTYLAETIGLACEER